MTRPRLCPDDVLLDVVQRRRLGETYQGIADAMNNACVRSPAGLTRWTKSMVWSLVHDTEAGKRLLHADDPADELAGSLHRRTGPRSDPS